MNAQDSELIDTLFVRIDQLASIGAKLNDEQRILLTSWHFKGVFGNGGLIHVLEHEISISEAIAAFKKIGAENVARAISNLVQWVELLGCKLEVGTVSALFSQFRIQLLEREREVWHCDEEVRACMANFVRSKFIELQNGFDLVYPTIADIPLNSAKSLGAKAMNADDYSLLETLFWHIGCLLEKVGVDGLSPEQSDFYFVWYFDKTFGGGGIAAILEQKISVRASITAHKNIGAQRTAQAIANLIQYLESEGCTLALKEIEKLPSDFRAKLREYESAIWNCDDEVGQRVASYVRSKLALLQHGMD